MEIFLKRGVRTASFYDHGCWRTARSYQVPGSAPHESARPDEAAMRPTASHGAASEPQGPAATPWRDTGLRQERRLLESQPCW